MKSITNALFYSSLLLLTIFLSSCFTDVTPEKETALDSSAKSSSYQNTVPPATQKQPGLPVKYQSASYVVDKQDAEVLSKSAGNVIRVGARISSTQGPQPLWDILKPLASMKRMNVSWAKDVDQSVLVDVDINAKDDFYESINNLLAQVGYFAEFKKTTIYVRNKITRKYQISMPFLTQAFSTDLGGDIMASGKDTTGVSALINLKTKGSPVGTNSFDDDGGEKSEFDIWANIEANLKVILDILETSSVQTSAYEKQYGEQKAGQARLRERDSASGYNAGVTGSDSRTGASDSTAKRQEVKTSRQVSKDGSYFIIDKPVGIITVTTTLEMHNRLEDYINSLKYALYKQITIEAKIVEVTLSDASSIGINWSSVLKNFNLNGVATFGANGQVYPFIYNNDKVNGPVTYTDATEGAYFKTINPGQFLSNITLGTASFDVFLNALNEQGDAKVLSNPKISVMNGQPAFITVGRNVTYIDNIESDLDTETGLVTYTVNTERILSGVGMALTATVLDDDKVIMNLVPITSSLHEPIEYRDVGNLGGTVGLPVVDIREMSTTVKVRDGEVLVIGGLISDASENKGEFAPLLGDIPFIKYLFGFEEKNRIKRELIILLKPRIF